MKIVLKNLTKVFPSKEKDKGDVIAANNFDFEIPDGKLVGLLGPSGCGKSTTLNLISGLINPTSGRIYFGDDDVTELPPEKRGIGLVFQNYALYPHLTVRENIRFPLENLKGEEKLTKAQMEEKVLEAARLVQIENLLNRKPKDMSGGQQQRAAIARALVKMPKVLLLDEPLSNLDARLRLQTREEIRRIQKETKITTVFVTHDQEEAMSISDMIVVMKEGVIHQIGNPQEVYDNPSDLFVAQFLGNPQINTFNGEIKDGYVCIGEDKIIKTDKENQEVYVCIRPEGFILDENGPFVSQLEVVEVLGKDVSIVSNKKESINPSIRSIVASDENLNIKDKVVRFSIKPNKIFVYSKSNEERISL